MQEPEDQHGPTDPENADRKAPGGPYFGRLLIVLFAAVAFCAVITWALSTMTMSN